ncbi:MAG: dTDP-4-dehydrorhamnose 3,5-epimerase [Chloroherpetonaceae bacterium]|nr:dTDP-4-dehydrorhamnose 3,5-epimerase [Chloroherpetonaceae bacterium]
MKVIETPIQGLVILEPKVFEDARGFFYESYNEKRFHELGIKAKFVQDNISRSVKGVLRGLHYQLAPFSQGKLVRVSIGEVLDVAVDLRKGSPTFGQSFAVKLSEQNRLLFWVPEGFAHGFLVLSETAEFNYKVTNYYTPASDRTLLWNDPGLKIDWGIHSNEVIISDKDRIGKTLNEAEINFVFQP